MCKVRFHSHETELYFLLEKGASEYNTTLIEMTEAELARFVAAMKESEEVQDMIDSKIDAAIRAGDWR